MTIAIGTATPRPTRRDRRVNPANVRLRELAQQHVPGIADKTIRKWRVELGEDGARERIIDIGAVMRADGCNAAAAAQILKNGGVRTRRKRGRGPRPLSPPVARLVELAAELDAEISLNGIRRWLRELDEDGAATRLRDIAALMREEGCNAISASQMLREYRGAVGHLDEELVRFAAEHGQPISRQAARGRRLRIGSERAKAMILASERVSEMANELGVPVDQVTICRRISDADGDPQPVIAWLHLRAAAMQRRRDGSPCRASRVGDRTRRENSMARCKCERCYRDLRRELSGLTHYLINAEARGLDRDDAEQEASISLLHAMDTWDDTGPGARFVRWYQAYVSNSLHTLRKRRWRDARIDGVSLDLEPDFDARGNRTTLHDFVADRTIDVQRIVIARETIGELIEASAQSALAVAAVYDAHRIAVAA